MDLAAVVLAGGRSRRFGANKLLRHIDGRPVVGRVMDALRGVTDRLYVSVTDEAPLEQIREAAGCDVKVIQDLPGVGCVGPALGISSSLISVKADHYLIVPGDIPWLDTETTKRFVRFSLDSDATVVAPAWENGMVEILFQFHHRNSSGEARRLSQIRRESMRPSDFLRAFRSCFVGVGSISENPFCFSNVNTEADLRIRKTRGDLKGTRTVHTDGQVHKYFWEASGSQATSCYKEAAESFEIESKFYEANGPALLAMHALVDTQRCLRLGGLDSSLVDRRLRSFRLSLPVIPRP
jgi:molybdopterin-guanine dinucleotide biosynthesis protein A